MKDDDNNIVDRQMQQLYQQRKSVHPLPELVKQQLHKAAKIEMPRQQFWQWASLWGSSISAGVLLFLLFPLLFPQSTSMPPDSSMANHRANQQTLSEHADAANQIVIEYQPEMELSVNTNEVTDYDSNMAMPAAPPAVRFDKSAESMPSIEGLSTDGTIVSLNESMVTAKLAVKQDDQMSVKLIDCLNEVHNIPSQQLTGFVSGQWVRLHFNQTHQLQRVEAVSNFKGCE